MAHKFRMLLGAVLLTLALLGTGWVASSVPPISVEGLPGDNRG